jgi:subtilisin family serine protease
VLVADNGLGVDNSRFGYGVSTLAGHASAAGAATVGAADYVNTPLCGVTPALVNSYSAVGGTPMLFDTNGQPLPTPIVRAKPDFIGPDSVSTTFFGYLHAYSSGITQCTADGTHPRFTGTSAAAPHAAAVAALLRQAAPAATPDQVYAALRATALDMDAPGFDTSTGYGFIQADAALNLLAPQGSGGGGGGGGGGSAGGGGGGGLGLPELLAAGVSRVLFRRRPRRQASADCPLS